jgi:hypothetical protein
LTFTARGATITPPSGVTIGQTIAHYRLLDKR